MSLSTSFGSPSPLGVSMQENVANFALFSEHATRVTLSLFHPSEENPFFEAPLKKTKSIWHIAIKDLPGSFEYTYRCSGPYEPQKGHLFNEEMDLVDPYAKDLNSSTVWNGRKVPPRGRFTAKAPFDWGHDARPMIPLEETIIYEMHVRSFTQHGSSQTKAPGSFLGLIEKIPHLKELGVNAVELMPVHEFNERENQKTRPKTGEKLFNYWGYSTANFFTPMRRYGSSEDFKALVKALHAEGIEVILDVVYNHTSEGSYPDYYYSFRGIDNKSYYIVDEHGYHNYTGCGNTVNCNHPAVQDFILDSLRYWVLEYHVDGFRFDLASILCRGEDGKPLTDPPLIKKIAQDPLLGPVKLIAEPWDPGGLYQVGSFPSWRFSEWNGKYRDTARKFLRGAGGKEEMKKRFLGSPDLYEKELPTKSINFITVHDGFTLRDLVSYDQKHNTDNGEQNQDGSNDNESWNCGVEGPTEDPQIIQLRERQMRNMLLMLLTSQGVPMILMGDEYGHTRNGNNNPWCQDNELNYFLWNEKEKNPGLFRFCSQLIHFRKAHPLLSQANFLTEVQWDTLPSDQFLSYSLKDELAIAFNASPEEVEWQLPLGDWQRVVDTSQPSPEDFLEKPLPYQKKSYRLSSYSSILLIKATL